MNGMWSVSVFGLSHVGSVRRNNEDAMALCDLATGETRFRGSLSPRTLGVPGVLILVADGMGGEACGEVASRICAETVPRRVYQSLESADLRPGDAEQVKRLARLLKEAAESANEAILEEASRSHCPGMGTTLTAAILLPGHLVVGQVGDSRAYLIRNQRMTRLTRDQTLLNYLAEIGAPPPEDASTDVRRSILTQAVGTAETLDVKLTHTALFPGDTVLLCSDGLYNMVSEEELTEVIAHVSSLEEQCQALVDRANAQGGRDNITVVLAVIGGSDPGADRKPEVEVAELVV
jgi:serine/threonine protein phosphatase PrpC